MRDIEFYPRRQGRPLPFDTRDLETGQGSLLTSYNALKEEYDRVETLLDRLLNEQIGKIAQMLDELQQIKLHMASMSEADIEPGDGAE